MSLCTGKRALFLFPLSQHSHVLMKRSGPCHRPLPPRTPSETLHHPSAPPGPRGCREGTLPPTFGDPSIRRISPLFRFHSPCARATAPRLRSPQHVPPSPASNPGVPSAAAAIPHRGRAPITLLAPSPTSLRRGVPGERPLPPTPRSFVRRVRAASRRGRHGHTRTLTGAQLAPGSGRKGGGRGRGPPPPSPIARSRRGRAAPPPPLLRAERGRGGSERVGAQTCRNRARVSAGGRGARAGAGPFPPGAGSRPLVSPGGRDGSLRAQQRQDRGRI